MSASSRGAPGVGGTMRLTGLLLVACGCLVGLVSPWLGHYVVDDAALAAARAVADPASHAALQPAMAPLSGQTRALAWSLRGAVHAAIEVANATLPQGDKLWSYQRDQITYTLLRAAHRGAVARQTLLFALVILLLPGLGALLLFAAAARHPTGGPQPGGVMTSRLRNRGVWGVLLASGLVSFYVLLYFYPELMVSWIRLADPIRQYLGGGAADRWFFYGLLYSWIVVIMGVRMLVRYRHSHYQRLRTASVIFFQLGFAFLLPLLMAWLGLPALDLKNAWPLDYGFFYGYRLSALTGGGAAGWALLVWGIAFSLGAIPLLGALVGKRWYCSWVCGCGALAETLGDPFRHLSDKRAVAWRIERLSVHAVLVAVVVMTAVVLLHVFTGAAGGWEWRLRQYYGFAIGALFAGVAGTGLYPLVGNRFWCRFGCPLAALLGIVQRLYSRFRITVNGGQCISCGNCSTYCEMGIDVRAYAQRGENIVRASCVGCGVCAAVCPRGVLRLENGPPASRGERVKIGGMGRGGDLTPPDSTAS